ncbi:hypothetical protein [Bradyrhizobium sp. CCBAU 51753]|uniref:hypothetical protein n=1 Tax=Bradyrhizobium sp. CCBAU 51753 TaxID=1325100 RepID=UPI00188D9CC7|nr:hypothetical protein [Bradyrhizobium sp. CCBAU 51753]
MKVVPRLIDLMVAFCIKQFCHHVSGRQLIAQTDAPTCPCPGEQQDAAAECRPLKRNLDKSGVNGLPPR